MTSAARRAGLAAAATLILAGQPARADDPFPVPEQLAPAARFWVDVFTRYSQHDYVIHDRIEPGHIYDVVTTTGAGDEELVAARVRAVVDRLALASLTGLDLASPPQVPAVAPEDRVRVQRGMREVFGAGLTEHRRFRQIVERALEREGLPLQLSVLPLVESSYNPEAVSRAGATGMWQFTATTARRYLRIHGRVDERLDPVRSSHAAARHLRELREALPSWPLALTAYNHGITGVERARRAIGSDDLGLLVSEYRGPGFGFASRNFYAEFLAARHVVENVASYFPEQAPNRLIEYRVKRGDTIYALARRHGVTVPHLLALNGRRSRIQPGQVLLIRL
jgi:membrane-bound lytic murein transglycosylase D